DHRHVGQRGIGLDLASQLPAIHDRHHQVEQDDAGLVAGAQLLEGVPAVDGGADLMTFELERYSHHLADVVVVLNYQDLRHLVRVPPVVFCCALHGRASRRCTAGATPGNSVAHVDAGGCACYD